MPALRFRIQSSLLPCPSGRLRDQPARLSYRRGRREGRPRDLPQQPQSPPLAKPVLSLVEGEGSGGILGLLVIYDLEVLGRLVPLKYRRISGDGEILHPHITALRIFQKFLA